MRNSVPKPSFLRFPSRSQRARRNGRGRREGGERGNSFRGRSYLPNTPNSLRRRRGESEGREEAVSGSHVSAQQKLGRSASNQ